MLLNLLQKKIQTSFILLTEICALNVDCINQNLFFTQYMAWENFESFVLNASIFYTCYVRSNLIKHVKT